MANVVIVYPVTGLDLKNVSVWLPLAALSAASPLVGDYDVAIIDQRIDASWRDRLREAIGADTLCVGISSMTGTQIKGGLAAARAVREIDPDIPIVWGGNHATLVPGTTIADPLVDIAVLGEGEGTFRRLVECLEKKRPLDDVPDIAFTKAGTPVVTGPGTDPSRFLNLDDAPPLPYHLVDVERYISGPAIFGRAVRALPYITSRGCPYSCTFCCQPVLSRRVWRKQSAERVLERTMKLISDYRLDAIEFHDEEFFVDRKRGARIAEMIGGDYEWYVQTRMDDLLALDLDRLVAHGLRVVHPGLETGSPRMLELIKKDETVEVFLESNRKLAASGLLATYNFMMGYPTETRDDLIATVDLALRLIDENPRSVIAGFYVYVPYPGAELYHAALKDGFVEPATLNEWSTFNRQHLATPWIEDRRDELEMLLYSSKFVDGRRHAGTFGGTVFARKAIAALSSYYRRRWRKRDFRKTIDIELIAIAAKKIFGW